MSFKNDLQEIYQKKGDTFPIYTTLRVGGTDHNPCFVSTVTLPSGIVVKGKNCSNRKAAEKSAAEEALRDIREEETNSVSSVENYDLSGITLYIDMENLPKEHNNIKYPVEKIGYVSRRHAIAQKVTEYDFPIIIVNSLHKDASDVFMCMDIAEKIGKGNDNIILILTKDHFGKVATEWIDQAGLETKFCITASEVNDFLEAYIEEQN